MWIRALYEGIVQAVTELSSNKLRSFLSSLGITIGIFCIISVLSAVDSLESNVSKSFEKLGTDVLYIDRFPWNENPQDRWWKYGRRPPPNHDDLDAIKDRVTGADYASLQVFMPGRTVSYKSNNVRGAYMVGVTYDYAEITKLKYEHGRYFTPFEYTTGANRAILGSVLATEIFGDYDPTGREVKIWGRKFQVVGVLEKEGNSIIDIIPYDEAILVSYNTAKKLINVRTGATWGSLLNIKANEGVNLEDLTDEVTGIMRASRRLRPKEDDNFSINEMSVFTKLLAPIFAVMNSVGFVIGIFAIIVGIFSVANIMFVSVKERTNIIGIKKALGAKNWVILVEFLIEAVLLVCRRRASIGLVVVMGLLESPHSSDWTLKCSYPHATSAVALVPGHCNRRYCRNHSGRDGRTHGSC